jgi:hypothetical protein
METNTIISKAFGNHKIRQRETDGYLSATDMCKVFGKLVNDYMRLSHVNEYLEALRCDTGYPVSQLVQIRKGNSSNFEQGTWVHPMVATHLAQWLSPVFSIQVNKWVLRYLSGDITLVKEVVDRHDQVHGGVTTQINFDRELELSAHEKRLELMEFESKKRVELEEAKYNEERAERTRRQDIEYAERLRRLEIDTVAVCTPYLTQVEAFKGDAHLYTAVKGYVINTMTFDQRAQPAIAPAGADQNDLLLGRDISQIIRDNHWKLPNNRELAQIGKAISKEYRLRYGRKPPTADKHVAGSVRPVKVYPPADIGWVRQIIEARIHARQ